MKTLTPLPPEMMGDYPMPNIDFGNTGPIFTPRRKKLKGFQKERNKYKRFQRKYKNS